MTGLEEEAVDAVEKNVDSIIKDPKKAERLFSLFLTAQGIESNLETILSFIDGLLLGGVSELYNFKFHKGFLESEEELLELTNLLKRRAWEMREAFINTRIEK